MATRLGLDAKIYRNTNTYGSPTWSRIDNVHDLTYPMEKGEADISTRGGGGWRGRLGTLKDMSLDFDMLYDTADAHFLAVQDSYLNGTILDLLILDGDNVTTGNKGMRGDFEAFTAEKGEALEDAQRFTVTLKPNTKNAHFPVTYTVP